MRVLIIEDNRELAGNLVEYLEQRGFAVDYAHDGITGLHVLMTAEFDVVVLDLGLPGCDGLQLCEQVRASGKALPIIVLTARDDLHSKISGLDSGADDYLIKPVALAELEARIRAQIRRHRGLLNKQLLKVSDLELDERTMEVRRAGQRVPINRMEFSLLRVLMLASPAVVTRSRLESEVWGEDLPESDTLRAHMHRLRRVIDHPFEQPLLHTVHRVGYRLVPAAVARAEDTQRAEGP